MQKDEHWVTHNSLKTLEKIPTPSWLQYHHLLYSNKPVVCFIRGAHYLQNMSVTINLLYGSAIT